MCGVRFLCLLIFALVAAPVALAAPKPSRVATLSIIGTSDLHGHIAALPWLAGYLANLRAVREPGGVVLLDAGDMVHGTLESNLGEGAPVIRVYNGLGYAAVALGNHEFDFGPVGPKTTPETAGDDPRGALKARASEARFPFLAVNVLDQATGKPVAWPNFRPSTIVEAASVRVGIIGAATPSTPRASLPANLAGLTFVAPAPAIAAEARKLRRQGAEVVIAVVHEGGACTRFADPDKLDSCDVRSEIFAIARALPRRAVDAIVAGHTHQGLAHRVAGIPIIQAYANGRAFGRVDLKLDRRSGKVVGSVLHAPRDLCPGRAPEHCQPPPYEGQPVRMDVDAARLNAIAFAHARKKSDERLGVEVLRPLPRSRGQETALGNLLADLVRAAMPKSDVAMINSGSIRAALPAGPLTFGRFYQAFPFDNASAFAHIPAGELRGLWARSLGRSGSLISLSGVRLFARCQDGALQVTLTRPDGSSIADDETLALVTTDFLATGGDGFFGGSSAAFAIGGLLRDGMVEALRARGKTLDPADRTLFDPGRPRLDLPGRPPLTCGP